MEVGGTILAVQIIGQDMKNILAIIILTISTIWAQIPDGYYDNTTGLTGPTLQQTLHDIIDNHNVVSYGSLWTHYQTTDVKQNGKVWDMYSDIPGGTPPYEFTFVADQCGNYGGEGDCYNREHSWPKSWFNDTSPMNTDIVHVVPSDGYVNGQRGNYPYGEVGTPTWTSQNGSKRGSNTYPGYSGTVFEPIDEYKGDFARIYFYMSTRYLNEDSSWPGSPMANGAQLLPWAQNMMKEWHAEDPVSEKEINRNDANYGIQNNRNPFVDHPNYVDLIWGGSPTIPEAPSNLAANPITDSVVALYWDVNSDNEIGIYVYQNEDRIATLSPQVNDHVVEQLQPATSYTFSVSAFNGAGESPRSTLNVTTLPGEGDPVPHFSEDFEYGSTGSYLDGTVTLHSGIWNAYQAGNFFLGNSLSGSRCLAINDDQQGAQITTPPVNTLGVVSFYYYQRNGAASDEFQLQKSSNGAAFEMVTTQSYNVGEAYTLFSVAVNDTSSSIRIRIVNDYQAGHLIIDDLTVTHYDPVSIGEEFVPLPENLILHPAYPNPFNPEVTLNFQISSQSEMINIQVFDIQGQLLANPIHHALSSGSYSVTWDGTNQQGENLPSGIYLVRLSNSHETRFQRVTLLR
jgi:endonuclease I